MVPTVKALSSSSQVTPLHVESSLSCLQPPETEAITRFAGGEIYSPDKVCCKKLVNDCVLLSTDPKQTHSKTEACILHRLPPLM